MQDYWLRIALVLVLVLINAGFAGSEMALVSLRDSQIQRLERASRGGQVLARLVRDPNRYLATIQIGITLAGFLASASAAVALAEPLVGPLGFLGSVAEPAAIVVVTVILAFFTLVIGELAPKRIAMQRAEGWALLVARPLDALSTMSRPPVWLLGRATNLLVRLSGVDPNAARQEVTAGELREMVASQRSISPDQRTIISGAFEVVERILKDIVVPRRDVFTLPSGMPAAAALGKLGGSGHSRAPVVGLRGLDDVIGVVHLRRLLAGVGTVDDHARPPLLMPETLPVTDAIRQLRQQRQQFAFVIDERGATDGIVTMEDLVEEIVGEIYDETDQEVPAVIREPDGALLLVGSYPIHDLPEIGIEPTQHQYRGDYTTVAGMILARLGHIPTAPGETVTMAGLIAEVVEIKGRAITRVRLRPRRPGVAGTETDETRQ